MVMTFCRRPMLGRGVTSGEVTLATGAMVPHGDFLQGVGSWIKNRGIGFPRIAPRRRRCATQAPQRGRMLPTMASHQARLSFSDNEGSRGSLERSSF